MFSIGERTTLNPCGSFLWTPANSLKSDPLEITNTRGTQNSWKSYKPGGKKKQPVCNQTCQDWKTFHPSDSSRCTRNNVLWSDTAGGLISFYNCRKDHENEVFSTPSFGFRYLGRTTGEEAIQNGRNPRCRSDRRGARRGQTDRGFVYSGAAATSSSNLRAAEFRLQEGCVKTSLLPFFFIFFLPFLIYFTPFSQFFLLFLLLLFGLFFFKIGCVL